MLRVFRYRHKLCSLIDLGLRPLLAHRQCYAYSSESESEKCSLVDEATIDHLERLALVDFNNQEGINRLTKAIQFADQLLAVDTTGVEPMDSVLEDRSLYLREDKVTEGSCRESILQNAAKTEEDYFVAPPGNIVMPKKDRSYGPESS